MDFKERLIELAKANVEAGGRPFSCLIVKDGVVLAEGVNRVAQTHDPTAHAEIYAIREATAKLHTEHLIGCTFYILAHPCPMCLAAMYYCSPDRVVFLVTTTRPSIRRAGSTSPFPPSTMSSQNRGTSDGCRWSISPIRTASQCIGDGRNSTLE